MQIAFGAIAYGGFARKPPLGIGTHLFVKVTRLGDSEVTF